eukprot:gb/GFBE01017488.1/.p1 GENE.gb/GFBE01017488.1/~~gb/GFBE01017488.1/.p1  ORF type:complete len:596 (+),score=138.20 gb/GFBE01017488.1/:1-1788(+)
MSKRLKARGGASHASADSKGLPPGWIRVESRSKPGVYFYAHPATKRTQAEHPDASRHSSSKRPEGPARSRDQSRQGGASCPLDVDEFEDPAEKAERLRKEAEEAEAAEAARLELVRQQRAAKQALLKEAEGKKGEEGSDEEKDLVSQEELERWKQNEERREVEEAEAERKRKEEEECQRKEAEEAERQRLAEEERRRQEEEAERKRKEEEEVAKVKKRIEMARKEAEFEAAMARERQKKDDADKDVIRMLEAEKQRKLQLEERQKKESEDVKKAEAELRRKAEADKIRKEFELQKKQNEPIPEPSDHIAVPCLDVFKNRDRIGRFLFSASKQSWTFGRAPEGVDFRLGHESISRKHVEVSRQGCFTFLRDLGSAHGTVLNGQKLAQNSLERLCSGDNIRLGGSARTYVYREPSTAIQLSSRGIRLKTAGQAEQDVTEPVFDSPKISKQKPSPGSADVSGGPVASGKAEPPATSTSIEMELTSSGGDPVVPATGFDNPARTSAKDASLAQKKATGSDKRSRSKSKKKGKDEKPAKRSSSSSSSSGKRKPSKGKRKRRSSSSSPSRNRKRKAASSDAKRKRRRSSSSSSPASKHKRS